MKTVLIALFEFRNSDEKEVFAKDLAAELIELGAKPTVFCDTTMGTELMEELRVKGITVFDMEHKSYTQLLPEYDAIVALDEFGQNNVPKTTSSARKISITDFADVDSKAFKIFEAIEKIPIKTTEEVVAMAGEEKPKEPPIEVSLSEEEMINFLKEKGYTIYKKAPAKPKKK